MTDIDLQVRHAVYQHFVATGQAPTAAGLAVGLGLTPQDTAASFQRLFERRLLVLGPDREQILMAPPFSGIATQHRVIVGAREYFANCAWDALGVVAALHQDGLVRSRCEQSHEPLDIPVHADGPDPVPCVIHFAVPASLWWRDIVFTWNTMLFFRSEERVDEWCEATHLPRRPLVTLPQLWQLSVAWYGNRLTPEARRPAPSEMVAIFASIGLSGPFWDPQADTFR